MQAASRRRGERTISTRIRARSRSRRTSNVAFFRLLPEKLYDRDRRIVLISIAWWLLFGACLAVTPRFPHTITPSMLFEALLLLLAFPLAISTIIWSYQRKISYGESPRIICLIGISPALAILLFLVAGFVVSLVTGGAGRAAPLGQTASVVSLRASLHHDGRVAAAQQHQVHQ